MNQYAVLAVLALAIACLTAVCVLLIFECRRRSDALLTKTLRDLTTTTATFGHGVTVLKPRDLDEPDIMSQ